MKNKAIAIFLFCCISMYYIVGTVWAVLNYRQCQQNAFYLKNNPNANNNTFKVFHFSHEELNNKIKKLSTNEFIFNNHRYDIINQQIINDCIIIKAFKDDKEQSVVDFFESLFNPSTKETQQSQILKWLQKFFFSIYLPSSVLVCNFKVAHITEKAEPYLILIKPQFKDTPKPLPPWF